MKKMNNKGFALVETLVVTIFIATVLIFLFIQLTNLSSSYEDSFNYNSVESLYALDDIKEYIVSDSDGYENIKSALENNEYKNIYCGYIEEEFVAEGCNVFTESNYEKLLELENISEIIVVKNSDNYETIIEDMDGYTEGFKNFISKINNKGNGVYRIIASFKNGTYATVRFGE